ncbi:ImmA/IrrE family metallo-endopeptidase [Virgibacillus sp. Bac332]|uniref:ImmA/IrrE family metallo-endopeptidase n=1 Tax=Virgibacillus sp. Bac332 TaxID=2419842 RepID=UPI000EF53698|nr:ImmA/IrrE family metallo-endopeptidase [Virgibacillus sp. Bac332]
MRKVKKRVSQLVERYETNNPFEIAKSIGVVVRHVPLGNLLGYHCRQFRTSIIHINEVLPLSQQTYVCAHELGHAIFHPDADTSFLKSNTFFSTDQFEVEANTFAIELLFSNEAVNSISIREAVEKYRIPEQFLNKFFYD